MLNSLARGSVSKILDPIGRALLRTGLTPNMVTVIGTLGVVGGAIGLIATGNLLAGTIVITFFVLFDLLDGAMARARGHGTAFGVVLDASCDRLADGALFGSVAFYAFYYADSPQLGIAALLTMGLSQVVSYIKARADSVALMIGGSIAERAERNVLGLLGTGLAGFGVPFVLSILTWVLAAACLVTVVQRLLQVRLAAGRQDAANASAAGAKSAGGDSA